MIDIDINDPAIWEGLPSRKGVCFVDKGIVCTDEQIIGMVEYTHKAITKIGECDWVTVGEVQAMLELLRDRCTELLGNLETK